MTPIPEIIFSGFVSKAVNDIVDVSKDKIRKAVINKNAKHQNIESQIYNVIVDVLNKNTYNQYENNQDKIYDAAYALFRSFKENKGDNVRNIQSCLRILGLKADENGCLEFKVSLYEELGREEYGELFRAILLLLLDQKSQYDNVVYEQLNQKLDEVILILNQEKNDDESNNTKQKIKSRTQEYADKWNANMFLNDFDEWDEKAGVNVKLSDVYIDDHLPHFVWGSNVNISTNLNTLLSRYITGKTGNEMLLILGQPGIGKSTLVTWITANFADQVDNILVYRFASDLKGIDWQDYSVSYKILDILGVSYNDLSGKTLILDGFDEVYVSGDRKEVLDKIYWNLVNGNNIADFSLIITCRENYINKFERVTCSYITLKPWDEKQIKSFCKIFQQKTKIDISESTLEKLLENRDILGIPLILYMVLALNISIEKEGSIVDVYDKIFSLDGGIYDRCIDYKSFSEKHRIGKIKEQIHQISRDIAIWMFENKPEEACIPKNEYQSICDSIMLEVEPKNKDNQQDFLIGNYFKLKHCEGFEAEELYFVHRSIYEYFVAETIYSLIPNTFKNFSKEDLDKFAGIVSIYLKKGQITQTICKYLQHKILKLCSVISQEELTFYQWMEMAIDKMVNNGMFYFSEYRNCNNIINKEMKCFTNLVKILRQLHDKDNSNYILMNVDRSQIEKYIKYCCITFEENKEIYLNLNKTFLKNVNLAGTNLSNIHFINAMLERSNLSRANLEKANLSGAILKSANLESAILNNADLSNADLSNADLSFSNLRSAIFINTVLKESALVETNLGNANLTNANLEKANLRGAILENANLGGANLSNADLSRTIIIDVDLVDTKLYNVILTNTIIDKKQVGFFEGECNLQDSWVLYNDELIRYEEFSRVKF